MSVISKEACCSRRSVIRAIDGLIKKRCLLKALRKDGKTHDTNLYTLKTPPWDGEKAWGGASQTPGVVTDSHQGSDTQSPKGILSKEIPNKEDKSSSPAAPVPIHENGNGQSLHVRIRLAFEKGFGADLPDYGKEGKCINTLITRAKKYAQDDLGPLIFILMRTFWELRQRKREPFWSEAPFLPSELCSRFAKVLEVARQRSRQPENSADLAEALAEIGI